MRGIGVSNFTAQHLQQLLEDAALKFEGRTRSATSASRRLAPKRNFEKFRENGRFWEERWLKRMGSQPVFFQHLNGPHLFEPIEQVTQTGIPEFHERAIVIAVVRLELGACPSSKTLNFRHFYAPQCQALEITLMDRRMLFHIRWRVCLPQGCVVFEHLLRQDIIDGLDWWCGDLNPWVSEKVKGKPTPKRRTANPKHRFEGS